MAVEKFPSLSRPARSSSSRAASSVRVSGVVQGVDHNEERDAAIRSLRASPNFVRTHAIVNELQSFPHFTHEQAAPITEACLKNSQVSWIYRRGRCRCVMQRILTDYGPHLPQVDREALEALRAGVQQ